MEVSAATVIRWMQSYADELHSNRQYLTDLDGPIGDNDHGINMDRGFQAVSQALSTKVQGSIEDIFKTVSMTLIKTVGGASGPLYGTVFLRMAVAVRDKERLTPSDLARALEAGRGGIVDRGKAEIGDATMLDAWQPAAEAFRRAEEDGQGLEDALDAAVRAAEQGMQGTVPLVARKGRASYLGERSAGHQDPGATSTYLLFSTLRDAVALDGKDNGDEGSINSGA